MMTIKTKTNKTNFSITKFVRLKLIIIIVIDKLLSYITIGQ